MESQKATTRQSAYIKSRINPQSITFEWAVRKCWFYKAYSY